eukprot:m.73926 g.73926  ORF g.73926 m.73926 type:complete len:523 (+) comp17066_c0_seq1:390-1958(+)
MLLLLGLMGLIAATAAGSSGKPPHIFMVLIDDFGWGNVGFHRNPSTPEVVTPNIDSLVKEGIELDRHYVHFACTPTRSSLQSGRLPIHVQLTLADPCTTGSGIPKNMTGVAAKLQAAGYATHQVGKWDAGMAWESRSPPTGRGYQTSLNYFSHGNWMNNELAWGGSTKNATQPPTTGVKDLWDTNKPALSLNGTGYESAIFEQRLLSILEAHDPAQPLFLFYGARVAHYPLMAPREYLDKFAFIDEPHRRVYHAMVNYVDGVLGNVTQKMKDKGMWDNTLMVLSSDNGGYVKEVGPCDMNAPFGGINCFNGEAGANNFPLRGGKYSSFEGGIRVNAFASGGLLPAAVRGTKLEQPIHVADWYSTFCGLAGVDPTDHEAAAAGLPPIDSLDVWPLLSGANNTSPRQEWLVDEGALLQGEWKLLTGRQIEAGWAGPQYPNTSSAGHEVCTVSLACKDGCLFNVVNDPTEHVDLAAAHPDRVAAMKVRMAEWVTTIYHHPIPPNDPECEATAYQKYAGFLGPWLP